MSFNYLCAWNPGSTACLRRRICPAGFILDVIFKILSPDTGYLQKVNQILEKLMAEVRQAREKNMVDKVFFARYHRLFGIIKIGIEPDQEKILSPLISRFLEDFVFETLGEDYRVSSPETVPLLAMAVRDEIINLRLHLDNLEKKKALI